MPSSIRRACRNFMLEVLWLDDLEPQLRALGVRTDKDVEGPRLAASNIIPLPPHRPGRATAHPKTGQGKRAE
ncbi:MAG: hypothetical protein AB7E51_06660 [Pseudodesulfovibrio sp.]|uniref:hypothetical protein n=1 Tax=Pseudodesulfovibrio sp. TaxID=2035812 RepID=UPI003D0C85F9